MLPGLGTPLLIPSGPAAATLLTSPNRARNNPRSLFKNRVGKNLFGSTHPRRKRATQHAGTQRENQAANEKTASGVPHYRARYYSPTIGRFISRDPLGSPLMMEDVTEPFGSAELSQGPNLYEYVWDNPVNHVDSSGLGVLSPTKYLALATLAAKAAMLNCHLNQCTCCQKCPTLTTTARVGSDHMSFQLDHRLW